MLRAFACPDLLAASAVLELPRVAAVMPENPATMDKSAPVTKAMAVFPRNSPTQKANTMAIKIIRTEYSLFKKAIAPL